LCVKASARILEADTVAVLDGRDVAPKALDNVDDLFETVGKRVRLVLRREGGLRRTSSYRC